MSQQWSKLLKIPYILSGLVILMLFIMACGDDATPAPTQMPAATPRTYPDASRHAGAYSNASRSHGHADPHPHDGPRTAARGE